MTCNSAALPLQMCSLKADPTSMASSSTVLHPLLSPSRTMFELHIAALVECFEFIFLLYLSVPVSFSAPPSLPFISFPPLHSCLLLYPPISLRWLGCSGVPVPRVQEAVQEARLAAAPQAHPRAAEARAAVPAAGLPGLLLHHLQPAAPHPQAAPAAPAPPLLLP